MPTVPRRFLGISLLIAIIFAVSTLISAQEPPKGEGPDMMKARAEYFRKARAFPYAHIPQGARAKAMQQMMKMRAAEQAAAAVNGGPAPLGPLNTWTAIGPSPTNAAVFGGKFYSGRITGISIDPNDTLGKTIYIGGAEGGVWRTTDAGSTWTPLLDNPINTVTSTALGPFPNSSMAVGAVLVDPNPHTPAHILVGLGEENNNLDAYYGTGGMFSSDGGATWTDFTAGFTFPLNQDFGGPYIGQLAQQLKTQIPVSQTNAFVFAAINAGFGPNGGIYRSTDKGVTFQQVLPNLSIPATGPVGSAVLVDNLNPGFVYAALGDFFGDSAPGGGNGIYRSTDSGTTWTKWTIPASLLPNANLIGRITMDISPKASAKSTLYAAIHDKSTSGFFALVKSTDSGNTWADITPNLTFNNFCSTQCWYDMPIAVNPTNPSIVYLGGQDANFGGNEVIASTDGGNTWTDVSRISSLDPPHADSHALAFDAVTGDLYLGNDGGLWVTTTPGTPATLTWQNLNTGLGLTQFYPGMAILPGNPNTIIGGAQDNGTQKYSGPSTTWTLLDPCGDGGYNIIDTSHGSPFTVIAGCTSLNPPYIQKSTDGGSTFDFPTGDVNGINTGENQEFIPPVVVDPTNSQTLYTGTFKVYQTTNGAALWTAISLDLTGGQTTSEDVRVITPANANVVYAASSNGLLWSTNNASAGVSSKWNQLCNATLTQRMPGAITVDPHDATGATAYLGLQGFNSAHIWKITNGNLVSATCTAIDGTGGTALPNIPVNDIVVDPNIANTLYVATDIGVFMTSNANVANPTWTTFSTGLPQVVVLSLKLDNPTRTLVAGTHGRSAWQLTLPSGGTPTFSPSGTLTFPSTNVGVTTSAMTETITNTGSANLTFGAGAVALGGLDPGDFAIQTDNCSSQNVTFPTGTCTVLVTFKPTAAGSRTATLVFTDNATGSPQSVALSGTGLAPGVSFTAPGAFPNQITGNASAVTSVTITNNGTASLTFGTLTVTGTNSADFSPLSSDTCSGQTIAISGTCAIGIVFKPTATGARSATINIPDNAPGSPQTFPVSGTGYTITFPTAPLNFGNQQVSTVSAAQTVTLTNTGGSVTFGAGAVTLGGTNPGDFTISTDNCSGKTILALANCTISVKFSPGAASTGLRSAVVNVADNVNPSPQSFNVTGTGVNLAVGVTTANNFNFGSVAQNTSGTPQTVTVTNNGTSGALTFGASAVTITGTNSGDFLLTNDLCSNQSLNPTQTCTFTLTFHPTALGARAATLNLADNAPNSPQTQALTGTGVTSVVNLNPTSLAFGNLILTNTSAQQTVTLTNNTTGTLTFGAGAVTLIGANPGDFPLSQDTCSGASLAINATCLIGIKFAPTAIGARAATVNIADNGPASPQSFGVTGTGFTEVFTGITPFGNQQVGTSSAAQTVTMTNNGGSLTLGAGAVTLGGANPGDFTISTDNCSGKTITTGNTCTILVKFSPAAASTGARSAVVNVADNVNPSPQSFNVSGTGVNLVVGLSTINNFGSIAQNTSGTPQTVTVTNNGTFGALTFGAAAITTTGTNAGDFVIGSDTCSGNSFNPTQSCTFQITFHPTAVGARAASVSIADNAPNSPQTAALSGTGVAAAVGLSPGSLTFGNQITTTSSTAQTVTVTNNTSNTVTFGAGAITLAGANPADFSISADACSGKSLTQNQTCTFGVTFTPTATSARAATVNVADSDASSPQSLGVSGVGYTEVFVPNPLNFNNVNVGVTSAPQTIVLTNTGGAMTISAGGVTISGTNAADFSFASSGNTCSGTIAAGATCNIVLTFKPGAAGTRNATVNVADNVNPSPQTVPVTGFGAQITVTITPPSPLAFNTQTVGVASAPQTITVTNTGNANLTFGAGAVTFTGTNKADFAFGGTGDLCSGQTVTPNGICTVQVVFTPSVIGAESATVNFTDNATGSPQTENLTGTGTGPVASFSANPLAIGNQLLGVTSANQTLTLTNTGNANLTVTAVVLAGADFATVTDGCSGKTLNSTAPGNTCTYTLTLTPSVTGPRAATLTFTDNVGLGTQIVNVTGNGIDYSVAVPVATDQAVPGGTAAVQFTLTPIAGFNRSVAYTCSTTVPGGSCTAFVPASPALLNGSSAATVTATVAVPSGTATGNYNITFNTTDSVVTTFAHSATGTNTIAVGDFSVNAPSAPNGVPAPGGTVQFTVNTTAINGFSDQVAGKSCSVDGGAGTCTFSPTTGPVGTSITATVTAPSGAAIGSSHTVTFTIGDVIVAGLTHASVAGNFSIGDFTIAATTTTQTVTAGAPATYTITETPASGFNSAITFTCPTISPAAVGISCSGGIALNATTGNLVVSTTHRSAARPIAGNRQSRGMAPFALWLPLPGIALMGIGFAGKGSRKNKLMSRLAMLGLLLILLGIMVGCGGGSGGSGGGGGGPTGTQAGTYTITVQGASGTDTKTTMVTLVVQ